MKKILYIATLVATAFFSACSPNIEVRDLPAGLPKTDVSVDFADPNQPIMTVNDETVFTANWDFGNGVLLQGKSVKGFFPLGGYHKYTLTAINGAGTTTVVDSVKIENDNPDMVYDIPAYAFLVGKKGDGGKYWVYDQAVPGTGDVCFMTANYDWTEFWWNPYNPDEEGPSPDALNEIKFDLEGGFNFTRYETKDVELEKGNFVFNVKDMKIKFIGANIPDWNEANCDPEMTATGEYHVKILNEYELLLWQDQSEKNPDDFDYGWAWKFKARDLDKGNDPIYKLAGEEGDGGKTWSYDMSNVDGEKGYCYMTARYDWEEAWWNPYNEDDGHSRDVANEIKFDLDYNYVRYETEGVEAEAGSYTLDKDEMILKVIGADIPDGDDSYLGDDANLNPDATSTREYKIQILDETHLLLWQIQYDTGNDDDDYAWAWKFTVKK
jgi:hypothetical protein